MLYVQAVVEDILQEAVLQKLLKVYRPDIALLGVAGKKGNEYIRSGIKGFHEASKVLPHIVITDLDRYECPVALISQWMGFKPIDKFLFRVAVREIDAWLMADREHFAQFLGVPKNKVPLRVDEIDDPKIFVINLARKSRKKSIKDIIPVGTAIQGPGYNILLQEFVFTQWDPKEGLQNSESLDRTIKRLQVFLTAH